MAGPLKKNSFFAASLSARKLPLSVILNSLWIILIIILDFNPKIENLMKFYSLIELVMEKLIEAEDL